jgi:hypothetical protein
MISKTKTRKSKTELLSQVMAKWAMQCLANPHFIITTSGDHFVLYDLKHKKVIDYKRFGDLQFKGGEDGAV